MGRVKAELDYAKLGTLIEFGYYLVTKLRGQELDVRQTRYVDKFEWTLHKISKCLDEGVALRKLTGGVDDDFKNPINDVYLD